MRVSHLLRTAILTAALSPVCAASAQELSTTADQLNQLMSQFKVDN